ncbi:MAG: hypothetical protein DWQ01_02780 [Planctomycetota bacterium]|nr:MAG: hypothetical protein DWQ01_02780 [Planctomycetota bacterium]
MKAALRHQLAQLDRSLLALLNERARLLREVPLDDPGRRAALEDLMRRHGGPFDAAALNRVFENIDQGCCSPSSGSQT